MANPTLLSQGAMTSTTSGALSPAWGVGHAANDIGLLYVSTFSSTAPTLSVPAGFALLTSTAGDNHNANMFVYWCRATSGAQGAPTIASLAVPTCARIVVVRGCVTTGNPWEVAVTGTSGGTLTATYSTPAGTVLSANSLVLSWVSTHQTVATAPLSTGPTNANLTSIALDNNSAQPAGASEQGFIFVEGLRLAVGSTGNTTGNKTGSYVDTSVTVSFPNQFVMSQTPVKGTLTLTGIAPVIRRADTITPGTGALTISGGVTGTGTIKPGTGSLTFTPITPDRSLVTNTFYKASARLGNPRARLGALQLDAMEARVPATGVLALTGAAPGVSVGLPVVAPGTGPLVLTGAAPTIIRQDTLTPVAGALTIAGVAPVVSQGRVITPGTGALVLTGVAPVLIQGAVRVPTAGALTLTGEAAAATRQDTITPAAGSLVLTGVAPVPIQGAVRVPTAGALTLAGVAPVPILGTVLTPIAGALVLAGIAPVPIQGAVRVPAAGALTLTGVAPVVTCQNTITPSVGALTLSGKQASVSTSGSLPFITSFPLTENPMSQGSIWVQGAVDGTDWNNVKTTGGQAVGVADITSITSPDRYRDDIAHLKKTFIDFADDQYVEGVVYIEPGYVVTGSHEVELLLRFEITNGNARGYEIIYGWTSFGGGQGYMAVVRWEGGVGVYSPIYDPGFGSFPPPVNGDVIRAEVIGTNIYVYRNTVLVQTVDISGSIVFTEGQPGVGFWPADGAQHDKMGWSDFEAGNVSASPTKTPNAGALTLTGQQATVRRADTITPGTGSLVLTGAPAITSPTATPNAGALVLTGQAPVVTRQNTITPGTGALTLAGVAPVVTRQNTITPTTGALVLAGAAPVLSVPGSVQPSAGSLVLSGSAPVVTVQGPVQPTTLPLVLTGYAPVVTLTVATLPPAGPRATWALAGRSATMVLTRETTMFMGGKPVIFVAPTRPATWVLSDARRWSNEHI